MAIVRPDPYPGAPVAPASTGGAAPAAPDNAHIDWAAVLGGAAIAVAIAILSGAFGATLGLSAVSAEEGEGNGTLALILSAGWIIISVIAAYAAGGYVAGRMRKRADAATSDEVTTRDGINGLVVWAVGTILSAMVVSSAISGLASTAGNIAGTAAEAAGSAVGGLAHGAVSAAGALVPDEATADPTGFLSSTLLRPGTVTPESAAAPETATDVGRVLARVATSGEISDADRAYLVQVAAARTGLAPAEVEARVDEAITGAQATREQAAQMLAETEEVARAAAETARISAVLTGFLLTAIALVAAVAAYGAAVAGGRHRDEGRIFGGFAWRG